MALENELQKELERRMKMEQDMKENHGIQLRNLNWNRFKKIATEKIENVVEKAKRNKKKIIATTLAMVSIGTTVVHFNNTSAHEADTAIIQEVDAKDEEDEKGLTYDSTIFTGTKYNAVIKMEGNINDFMDKDLAKGLYEVETENQEALEGQIGKIFDNTYSAYIFANFDDYFKDAKVLGTLEGLPNIDLAQKYINDLDIYANEAGIPDNIVDLFSNNDDRNFMTKFKTSIDEYNNGNKEAFYQFLVDYENGVYNDVSPFARMMMMGLATANKTTYYDSCWDEKINVGKTESGSIRRKDWYFYQRNNTCEGLDINENDEKVLKSLNSTVYNQAYQQLSNAVLERNLSSEKYSNIKTYKELKETIVKNLSKKHAVGTEQNKSDYNAWYELHKELLEQMQNVGTNTTIVDTGQSHVVSEKITYVSENNLEEQAKPSAGEHIEVINVETGEHTISTESEYQGQSYTQNEIRQRASSDATNVFNTYAASSRNAKECVTNVIAHRYDYNLSGLDSKYHSEYKQKFDEVMTRAIKTLTTLANTNLPVQNEIVTDNTLLGPVKDESKDEGEHNIPFIDNQDSEKEETNNNTNSNTNNENSNVNTDTNTNNNTSNEDSNTNNSTNNDSSTNETKPNESTDNLVEIGSTNIPSGEIVGIAGDKYEDSEVSYVTSSLNELKALRSALTEEIAATEQNEAQVEQGRTL